jgi:hypothetical protein
MWRALLRGLAAAAVIGSLVGFPAATRAQGATFRIVGAYMTTEEAFSAYNSSNPALPPQVGAYPQGLDNIAFYFQYASVKPNKDTFRVGFTFQGGEVRHGTVHTFDQDAGTTVLEIPADAMQLPGTYKATLYVDSTAAKSVSFKVILTPTITTEYMITAKAWEGFGPNSKGDPAQTTTFASGATRVGVFFAYTGMAKTDVHYVAVYNNANGGLMHRSQDSTDQYVPDGSLAIILPADAGAYPKGKYRTDVYINKAMVKSITWTVK